VASVDDRHHLPAVPDRAAQPAAAGEAQVRFKVVSITGWAITPSSGTTSRKPTTFWYVLDSANCFHIVREFHQWGNQHGSREEPEGEARAFAAALEEAYP
jgi:hypothetical protein